MTVASGGLRRARNLGHRAVRRVLMFFIAITTLLFWLPFARALIEGNTYEWGLFGRGGAGVNRDFFIPSLGVGLALLIRWFGHRGARREAAVAMVGFFGTSFLVAFVFALSNPDALLVRGDTLGMRLSLAWLGPILFGAAAFAAIGWAATARGLEHSAGWSRANSIFSGLVVLLVMASVFLLLHGEQHGTSDGFGVRALGFAWLFAEGVLIPPRRSTSN